MLEVENVTKRFGSFTANKDISFQVPAGSIFGIAGPNGAGKSVLFSTISGFYRPSSGDVRFQGESIVGWRPHRICQAGLTRTFQTPQLFSSMTVEENLRVGAGFGNTGDEDPVPDLLDWLGLTAIASSKATNLDLYTTKMVVLGSALATGPKLLLLDEPMAGFSHQEVDRYCELISRIRSEWDVTVILIEHLLDVLIGISDHMLVLHYGEVLYQGEPEQVRNHPEVVDVYLGGGIDEEIVEEVAEETQ